jgi:hypothetical protein
MTEAETTVTEDAGAVETTETESKTGNTYTEDEVLERIQRETDKRVTEALKKQEHKFSQKLAEADKLRNMDAAQRKEYELEQKLAAVDAREKEFVLSQNKLEATKILSSRGLPVSFVDYIVADDADSMLENINTFETEFKAAVNDAVSKKIASPTPKAGTATQTGMTKEAFKKLSISDRDALSKTNPTLYKQFVGGN